MSTASSGKRKRSADPTFYAVKVGHAPGIYNSWNDAKRQTEDIKAVCMSCTLFALSTLD